MKNNSVGKSGKITKVRENNYDLLRIISTFAVILIHVNAFYVSKITKEAGNEYEEVMEETISSDNSSDDGYYVITGNGECKCNRWKGKCNHYKKW